MIYILIFNTSVLFCFMFTWFLVLLSKIAMLIFKTLSIAHNEDQHKRLIFNFVNIPNLNNTQAATLPMRVYTYATQFKNKNKPFYAINIELQGLLFLFFACLLLLFTCCFSASELHKLYTYYTQYTMPL